jgi:TonB-linked SusC/RagA family outer membrane protein
MRKTVIILIGMLCISLSEFSQEKKQVSPQSAQSGTHIITGKIVDDKGEAVIGASVRVSKSETATISDASGKFSLSTNSDAILEISYIGYTTQKVAVNGKSYISINLVENSKVMDEVVVVGYGSQKKVSLTSAVSTVSGTELLKSPTPSLGNALTGKLPGVSTVQFSGLPGGDDPLILIRGVASLSTGGSAPLVMVDGVERSFTQIDPNEVADISVLKDASATAVFGVRGANGVILVTTKRGEVGKPRISASASFGIQAPTRYIDFTNSYEYATTYDNAQLSDGTLPQNVRFSQAAIQHFKNHDEPLLYPDMNWVKYIMKPSAPQSQQNVNITGGNERAKYFVSVGLLQQDGLFNTFSTDPDENFSYNRYNYRANLDLKIDKISSLAVNIGGRLEAKKSLPRGESDIFENIMFAPPMGGAGIVDGKHIIGNVNYIGTDMSSDPMRFYGSGHRLASTNVLNVDLIYTANLDPITKGLNFKLKGSYNSTSTYTKDWQNYQTYPTYLPYALADGATGLYPTSTVVLETSGDKWKPTYGEITSVGRDWYSEASFNYARKFGNHDVSALVLYNQSKAYYPKGIYPGIPHGYIGLVGRVTYNYASRYLFDFNVGRNGSENFAPGKRYGTFPAASVGWLVTEEPWMKEQKVISYLKFRYSYGLVGNDYMGNDRRFLYTSPEYTVVNGYYNTYGGGQHGYNFGTTNTAFVQGAYQISAGNPDVTWETSTKQNLGVDLKTFGDRLSVNIDVFNEDRKDILIDNNSFTTAPAALMAIPVNFGKVNNKGFEIVLTWSDKVGDFRYSISPNMAFNRNKIVEIAELKQNYDYLYRTGHRVNQPFGYEFFGFYNKGVTEAAYQKQYGVPMPAQIAPLLQNGDCVYRDLNGDGKVTVEDQDAIGFPNYPEITFALNSNFSYKNFDFSMLWNGATNVSRSLQWPYSPQFGQFNRNALVRWVYDNSWTPATAATAILPRITFTNVANNVAGSSVWLQDASYIRLRNLEVGYTVKKLPFISSTASMRIYLNGTNLLTFCKFTGNDPENVGGGYQNAIKYPMMKVYNIGLKVNF